MIIKEEVMNWRENEFQCLKAKMHNIAHIQMY